MTVQNKPSFAASYSYGDKNQQMQPENRLKAFFNRIAVFLLKRVLFPGAGKSALIDESRVETSKQQLQAIGGESVKLKTPDGDVLDGMYLNAAKFKEELDKYFDYETQEKIVSGKKQPIQKLMLKKEFIDMENPEIFNSAHYYHPKQEVRTFYNQLKGLGLNCEFYFEGDQGFPCITLPPSSPTETSSSTRPQNEIDKTLINTSEASSESEPTAVIAGGSGMPYSAYKGYAVNYLLRGMNVMLVDFRGYGESQGSPSEHKLKLDLETAYQYLSQEKRVQNKDLLVHGHCLGGGPACDLAARRVGVNLLLDRGFAAYGDLAQRRFPLIRNIVKKIFPSIIDFNNVANISKVKGNIAVEVDTKDSVILDDEEMKKNTKEVFQKDRALSEQHLKVLHHLPESQKNQIIKLMDSSIGHTHNWMRDTTLEQFNRFLEQTHLFRRKLW